MSIFRSVGKLTLIPSVVGGNLATKGISLFTGKKYGTTTTEEAIETPIGKGLALGIAATGTALAIASGAAATTAAAIGKAAIVHPIQTTTATLIGIPLITGLLSTGSPERNIAAIGSSSYKAGSELGNVITEHPIAAAVIGSITGGVAAYEIGKALIGEAEQTTKGLIDTLPTPTISDTDNPLMPLPNPAKSTLPESASAEGSKPKSKRRKSKLKSQGQKISQRVDVRVGVIAGNKKYIKMDRYN